LNFDVRVEAARSDGAAVRRGSTVQDPTAAFEEFFGTERTRSHRVLFAITGQPERS
jgi:hypothetical protein